jgi:hypothetical protein
MFLFKDGRSPEVAEVGSDFKKPLRNLLISDTVCPYPELDIQPIL